MVLIKKNKDPIMKKFMLYLMNKNCYTIQHFVSACNILWVRIFRSHNREKLYIIDAALNISIGIAGVTK